MGNPSEDSELSSETSRQTDQSIGSDATTNDEQQSQESITDGVKDAGLSFKEIIASLADKAKTITEEKTQTLKDKSVHLLYCSSMQYLLLVFNYCSCIVLFAFISLEECLSIDWFILLLMIAFSLTIVRVPVFIVNIIEQNDILL